MSELVELTADRAVHAKSGANLVSIAPGWCTL